MVSLKGKKGLIIGIANEKSIAWGCAKALHQAGADLAITYLNDKAEPYVRPLAEQLNAPIILPLDVQNESEIKNIFQQVTQTWGKLDFLLHSIAFAPKEDLSGPVMDSSREGFLKAMEISCYSFIRLAHYAQPLMSNGGSILTVTYYGGEKYIKNYNLMGPVKAALESSVQYLAVELGKKKIRVNGISPSPLLTRAASGLPEFNDLLERSQKRSPEQDLPNIDEVGDLATFLVGDQAKHMTGNIMFIDSGLHLLGD